MSYNKLLENLFFSFGDILCTNFEIFDLNDILTVCSLFWIFLTESFSNIFNLIDDFSYLLNGTLQA